MNGGAQAFRQPVKADWRFEPAAVIDAFHVIQNVASIEHRARLAKGITGNISNRLMSLTMTDNRGFEADQLDIELDDADGLVELPLRGAVLALYLGWKGFALISKGSFTVDEVEHHGAPDTATIGGTFYCYTRYDSTGPTSPDCRWSAAIVALINFR